MARIKFEPYNVLIAPVVTEGAFDMIEAENKLVFNVHRRADKSQIRQAFEELFEVKVVKVNTMIRPDGVKRAFIRLHPDTDAMDVAMSLNMF